MFDKSFSMRVHFIAIGGSAMHNLAIALHKKGYEVTGGDDQIFEPSRSRLQQYGLLPQTEGWDESSISKDIDAIILGMHARKDNPELLEAQKMGLKIYSYPEYVFEQSKNKRRVVIGGSHGKTSITSMILHVLKSFDMKYDYLVGAQLEGYETMVSLNDENDLIILEGDEYLSSPIDLRPKFHWYKANIAVLTGIAWDHINVFPTFENYVDQFRVFIESMDSYSKLFYFSDDDNLKKLASNAPSEVACEPYSTPEHSFEEDQYFINGHPMKVFGEHNLQNLEAARLVLRELGISNEDILSAMESFTGAAKRLEKIREEESFSVFKDFAHSPSKLKATTKAVKGLHPGRHLVACMELHTFSSLNKKFLPQYEHSMDSADEAIVYFNPKTIEHKKLDALSKEEVKAAFKNESLIVFTDSAKLIKHLRDKSWENHDLLLMSSGNFDGQSFEELAESLKL